MTDFINLMSGSAQQQGEPAVVATPYQDTIMVFGPNGMIQDNINDGIVASASGGVWQIAFPADRIYASVRVTLVGGGGGGGGGTTASNLNGVSGGSGAGGGAICQTTWTYAGLEGQTLAGEVGSGGVGGTEDTNGTQGSRSATWPEGAVTTTVAESGKKGNAGDSSFGSPATRPVGGIGGSADFATANYDGVSGTYPASSDSGVPWQTADVAAPSVDDFACGGGGGGGVSFDNPADNLDGSQGTQGGFPPYPHTLAVGVEPASPITFGNVLRDVLGAGGQGGSGTGTRTPNTGYGSGGGGGCSVNGSGVLPDEMYHGQDGRDGCVVVELIPV